MPVSHRQSRKPVGIAPPPPASSWEIRPSYRPSTAASQTRDQVDQAAYLCHLSHITLPWDPHCRSRLKMFLSFPPLVSPATRHRAAPPFVSLAGHKPPHGSTLLPLHSRAPLVPLAVIHVLCSLSLSYPLPDLAKWAARHWPDTSPCRLTTGCVVLARGLSRRSRHTMLSSQVVSCWPGHD